jgi:hypothetical protein
MPLQSLVPFITWNNFIPDRQLAQSHPQGAPEARMTAVFDTNQSIRLYSAVVSLIDEDTQQQSYLDPVAKLVDMGYSLDTHPLRFVPALSGHWLSDAASVHPPRDPPAVDVRLSSPIWLTLVYTP